MDLIELAEELTVEDIAELLARRLLLDQQTTCRTIIDAPELSDSDKQAHRDALSNSGEMASSVVDNFMETSNTFDLSVIKQIREHAEEYTRDI